MGLLSDLAMGLKAAGGTLNPQVYQANEAEALQRNQQQTALQNAMLGHVIQAIQNGSMAAPEGSPFQASPQAQAAAEALAVKKRQDAVSQRILQDPQVQQLISDPTAANIKKVGALFIASGLPIPAHIKDLAPQLKSVAPGSSLVDDSGNVVASVPDRPKTQAPGTIRKVQVGTEEVTQELQADGTYKEIGRGPKFARQVAPVVNVGAQQGVFDPVKDKAELRDLAVQSLYDPNATQGFRRDTKAMAAIQRERIAVMREAGITSEDVVSGRAGFKADTASLNKITPQYDAITAFEKTAMRNGDVLVDLAKKVDTTGVPVVERWIRAGKKAVAGDPDVSTFNAQMTIFRSEAARILTNPNLTGVVTDNARHEVEDFLKGDASAAQIEKVVSRLKQDFEFRKGALEEQISSIRSRMRNRVAPGGGQDTPTPAPAGKTILKFDAQGNQIQ